MQLDENSAFQFEVKDSSKPHVVTKYVAIVQLIPFLIFKNIVHCA